MIINDELLDKAVKNIEDNHGKIIDDWCKAYMAQLYKEGYDIKPGCFTLNEQVPTYHRGLNCMVKKYWFEPGIPKFEGKVLGSDGFETYAKDGDIYVRPKWIKWHKDTLPEIGQTVLIIYKSGAKGATEFFYSSAQREDYIKWVDKAPFYEPIEWWMPFPDVPRDE